MWEKIPCRHFVAVAPMGQNPSGDNVSKLVLEFKCQQKPNPELLGVAVSGRPSTTIGTIATGTVICLGIQVGLPRSCNLF